MALRERHWAQELVADDVSKSCREFSIFQVEIELTDAGLENIDTVISMVYAYLALLKDIPEWVFEELKETSDMQFRFLSNRPPMDTVSSIVARMHLYPLEHYLSGPYKIFTSTHPSDAIKECWEQLTPDNMMLILAAKQVEGTTDQTAPWYGTQYKQMDIDEELLQKWRNPEPVPDLRLPDRNDMLATNFALVNPLPAFQVGEDDPQPVPRLISDSPTCRLWYKPDTAFSQPKVNIMILLRTSTAYAASPLHSVLASLWVEFLHEHCKEFSYAASVAGLHSDFHNTRSGMEFHVSGYNHKAGILLQRVVTAVKTMAETLTDEIFDRIVEKIRNQFSAFLVAQPYQHAVYASDLCLEDSKWMMQDRLESLGEVCRSDLVHFSNHLLSRFQLELLVHGNVSASEAVEFSEMILKGWEPKAPLDLPALRVVRLEPRNVLYRFRGWNEQDNNSCVLNLFQLGEVDLKTNAMLSLLHHLMREPAFNQLRTEEQLGYIVHTSVKTNGSKIKGLLILIQSDSFEPQHVQDRIDVFLEQFRSTLVEMSDDEFQTNVTSVCHNLLEKNKSLGEESSKHWGVIGNQTYRFRRLEEIASFMKELNKEDTLHLYEKFVSAKSPDRCRLAVHIHGMSHCESVSSPVPDGTVLIEDPKAFRREQSLFPAQVPASVADLMLSIES